MERKSKNDQTQKQVFIMKSIFIYFIIVASCLVLFSGLANAALSGTLTTSNTPYVDVGQYQVYTASVSGGIGPYTYNYIVTNSITGAILATQSGTSSVTSNTFVWQILTSVAGNATQANVTISDSSSNSINLFSESVIHTINSITVDGNPQRVALNPSEGLLYVVNIQGTIRAINTTTNQISNTITTNGSSLKGIAINPSGTIAYVANEGSASVSVINLATNTVINTITVGTDPYGISLNPSGTLAYVTNYVSDSISIINTTTDTVVNTIKVGTYPTSVAFNPSGTLAYVTNYESSTVSVINTATNSVVNTIKVALYPNYVAINPSGAFAYVTSYGNGTVNILNTATNTVVNTIKVGTQPDYITINPSGMFAYVSNVGTGTVSILNLRSNVVVETVTVGSYPEGIAVGPSGMVYVANDGSTTISILSSITTINTVPSTPTILVSNTMLEGKQYTLISSYETGGTAPYTYNFILFNSITNAVIANQLGSSNAFSLQSNSLWITNSPIEAKVTIKDSSAVPLFANSINSAPIFVINGLATPKIAPTTPINVDLGQLIHVSAYESGGTGNYLYNFIFINQTTNTIITNQIVSSNTFSLMANSILLGYSPIKAYVILYDVGSNSTISANSINSAPIAIHLNLSTPRITPNTSINLDSGEQILISAHETGGFSPYTYNFIIFNSVTNAVVANQLGSSNTLTFTTNSLWINSSPLQAKVTVRDSATNKTSANSINSAKIYVNNSLTGNLTASNTPYVNSGQYELLTATINGGVGPYTYNFIIANAITGNVLYNKIYTNTQSRSINISWQIPTSIRGQTLQPSVLVTDSASTPDSINLLVANVTNTISETQLGAVTINYAGTLAYVTNYRNNTIDVISTATNTVVNTIGVGPVPYVLTINPAGTIAYVPSHYSNYISVINLNTNTVINNITVGALPLDSVFNNNGTLAYVTNEGGSTVSVIDVATNSVVNTITVGASPYTIAINPAGTLAYVTNYESTTVSVINLATNTVINTITVGTAPLGVTFNPSGNTAYVAVYVGWDVKVINVSSNTIIDTIPVPTPLQVVINPAGTLAYVTQFGGGVNIFGNSISVINLATQSVVNNIMVSNSPYGVAFMPRGESAYITNFLSANVNIINVSSNTIVNTITIGNVTMWHPDAIAINPSGSTLYVTNQNLGTVSVIKTSSGAEVNTINVGVDPASIAINPQGILAYVANANSNTISIINIENNTLANTITGLSSPVYLAITPSGSQIYAINNGNGTISVINTTTNKIINTIYVGSEPKSLAFNPSGTLAYVTNYGSGSVSIISTNKSSVIGTIKTGSEPNFIAINPAGTLAYVSLFTSKALDVINLSTNTLVNTISIGTYPSAIAFNPQGNLAYVTYYYNGTINIINVGTNTIIGNVIASTEGAYNIVFNPAGTVAYATIFYNDSVMAISTPDIYVSPPPKPTVSVLCKPFSAGSSTNCASTIIGINPKSTVLFSTSDSTGSFSQESCNSSGNVQTCTSTYTDNAVSNPIISALYPGDNNNSIGNSNIIVNITIATPTIGMLCELFISNNPITCASTVIGDSPNQPVNFTTSDSTGNFSQEACKPYGNIETCTITYTDNATIAPEISAYYPGNKNNDNKTIQMQLKTR
jgi:large repetitive protein